MVSVSVYYRFCAQSMHYPHPSWFNDTYLAGIYSLLDALGNGQQRAALQNRLENSDDLLEELQVEYTRLFINGVPHVVAPPYGSIYLDRSLAGKFTEKILLQYQAKGYTLTQQADLPDHLIHQLEFLSLLAEDHDSEGEKDFLAHYFLPWYVQFSARVKENTEHPFYQTIIGLIDFFTMEEEEYGV